MELIYKIATKRNLFIGLGFIVLVNAAVFPLVPKWFGVSISIDKILDIQFGFDKYFVLSSLSSMGEKGREVYLLSTLVIDSIYAIIYGVTYTIFFIFIAKDTSQKRIVFFPFLISLFDLLENTGIVSLILNYPNISEMLVVFTSFANRLKWIFALLTIVLVIVFIAKRLLQSK